MKKNIISILLIIVGITLIFTSIGIKIYSKNKEAKLISNFNNQLKIEEKKNELDEDKKEKNNKIKAKMGDEISSIEIPSISLKSIVVEGIGKEQLKYALGHFEDTAMPGEYGNFSIAGHSSSIYEEILNNAHKVDIGDEIRLKTLKGNFKYKITKKYIVEPTEVSVLDQDKSKKTMTIVTCTDGGKKRLIIQGEI